MAGLPLEAAASMVKETPVEVPPLQTRIPAAVVALVLLDLLVQAPLEETVGLVKRTQSPALR